ncbi:hypothetical protein CYMTET_41843, partial [Cymbomonas tetramitiformis]
CEICGVGEGGDGQYDPSGVQSLADALVYNRTLTALSLEGNGICGEGAEALAEALASRRTGWHNRTLKTLTLTAGAEIPLGALRRNELTELNLADRRLGMCEAVVLGAILVHSQSLHTLNLRGNLIDARGVKALTCALTPRARGLRCTVSTLSLAGNVIGPEGAKALASALHPDPQGIMNDSLTALNLADCAICGVGEGGDGQYDPSGVQSLADALVYNQSLTSLSLEGNGVDMEGGKALASALGSAGTGRHNTTLKTLTMIEGAGLPVGALRQNELLELSLAYRKVGVCDAMLLSAVLVHSKNLQTLNLKGNAIQSAGVLALSPALTTVPGEDPHCLSVLNLEGNGIGPEGAAALGAALVPDAASERCNQSIASLILNDNEISGPPGSDITNGLEALAAAVRGSLSLTHLDLSRNHVGPRGTAALASGLYQSKSLKSLSLTGNEIGGEGAEALAAVIASDPEDGHTRSLSVLDIRYSNLSPASAKKLAQAIGAHPAQWTYLNTIPLADVAHDRVTSLELVGSGIGIVGAMVLARWLRFNHSIERIDLAGNNIGYAGAEALSVAFSPNEDGVKNKSVTSLNLSGNGVSLEEVGNIFPPLISIVVRRNTIMMSSTAG